MYHSIKIFIAMSLFAMSSIIPVFANEAPRISRHVNFLKECSEHKIHVIEDDLQLYSVPVASVHETELLRCALPQNFDVHNFVDSGNVATYPSVTDKVSLGDGPPRSRGEAIIRTNENLIFVTAVHTDLGVRRAHHVSSNTYLIETAELTGRHSYLLNADSHTVSYLSNGRVSVTDREGVFHVHGRKAYFGDGKGAFWFDAVIDMQGRILKIVTPPNGDYVVCMDRHQLAERSGLDLSRVPTGKVCVRR